MKHRLRASHAHHPSPKTIYHRHRQHQKDHGGSKTDLISQVGKRQNSQNHLRGRLRCRCRNWNHLEGQKNRATTQSRREQGHDAAIACKDGEIDEDVGESCADTRSGFTTSTTSSHAKATTGQVDGTTRASLAWSNLTLEYLNLGREGYIH